MRRLKPILLALAAALPLAPKPARALMDDVGGGANAFMNRRMEAKVWDRNALRAQVDESEVALDLLARETRSMAKAAHKELLATLEAEYGLSGLAGKLGTALGHAEARLTLQEAAAERRERGLDPTIGEGEREQAVSEAEGLEKAAEDETEALRDALRSCHKRADEQGSRDLRAWMMVHEGLLRQAREEAEAAAVSSPAPTAEALDAGALAPPSAAAPDGAPGALSGAAHSAPGTDAE